jgi:uncharacterized membrane protein
MQTLKSIIVATVVFLLMDGLWIGVIANQLYMTQLGDFLRIQNNSITPNFYAAAVVYIALIGGILIFVLPKAQGNPLMALMWGAVFGFVTYATYDFTNLAVLKNWPIGISIIDVVWGCILCGVTSFVTTWLK